MFDYYEPSPALRCENCGSVLLEWQGKNGPCELLVWCEGHLAPKEQRGDVEWLMPAERRAELRLTADVRLFSRCEDCERNADGTALIKNGRWIGTVRGTPVSEVVLKAQRFEGGWRQCGGCAHAWHEPSTRELALCPACRQVTHAGDCGTGT